MTRTSSFPTIRQAAAMPNCPYSEYTMRLMLHRGELPGFYSGTRFHVNFSLLIQQVDDESRSRMKAVNFDE